MTGAENKKLIFELIDAKQWEKVIQRLKKEPGDASLKRSKVGTGSPLLFGGHANLAIHEACKNQPPVEVIEAVLIANPVSVKAKGYWGNNALHYACSSGASGEVVRKLIEMQPRITRERNDLEDELPLHLASKWGASEDVLIAILTYHPEGIYIRDGTGKTPMDHAKHINDPDTRKMVVETLERGHLFCAVSKASHQRAAYEQDCRFHQMLETHASQLARVKEEFQAKLAQSRNIAEELQSKVEEEINRNSEVLKKVIAEERKESQTKEEKMEAALEKAKDILASLREEMTILKTNNDRLKTNLETEQAKAEQLESEKRHVETKLKSLEASVASSDEASTALKADRSILEADKKQLIADLEQETAKSKRLESEKRYVETKFESLEASCSELYGENQVLNVKVRDLEKENKLLSTNLDKEKVKVVELNGSVATLEERMEHATATCAGHKILILDKDDVIRNLEARLEVHEKAEQALANKAVKLENTFQEAMTDLRNERLQVEQANVDRAALEQQLAVTRRRVEAYEKRMETVKGWVNSFAFSMQTWTAESDWVPEFSGSDATLNAMAESISDTGVNRAELSDGESVVDENALGRAGSEADLACGGSPLTKAREAAALNSPI